MKAGSPGVRAEGPLAASPETDRQAFWHGRFYDFNVWSSKKRIEKLEYMHRNPVTRKLVEHPKDWPWSSYAAYAERGLRLVPIDFGD